MTTTPTASKELTPVQCQEQLDELMEMQQEERELRDKRDKAQETYKSLKDQHEVQEGKIIQHLDGLNQELPLFDNPEDIPFPFPLPNDDIRAATLANVAADSQVLGLSITVVKAVKEKLSVGTLGELEKHLGAAGTLFVDQITKAKKELAKKIGPSQAQKLLRAVASFTGGRTAKSPAAKKKDKAEANGTPEDAAIAGKVGT